MSNQRVKEKTWLCLTVISLVSGLPMAFLAVFFAIKLKYLLMCIAIAVALHGIWGFVFYYSRYRRTKLINRIYRLVCEGTRTPEAISEVLGLKPDAVDELISDAFKNGYFDIQK